MKYKQLLQGNVSTQVFLELKQSTKRPLVIQGTRRLSFEGYKSYSNEQKKMVMAMVVVGGERLLTFQAEEPKNPF